MRRVSDAELNDADSPATRTGKLGCAVKSAYCFPRLPFSSIDFVFRTNARVTVYRDALGMSWATQAMIISICKSLDFLLGFVVGKLSDNTRTRFGRRKPFLAACGPIFILITILIGSPGLFFSAIDAGGDDEDDPCASLVSASNLTSCADLHACLDGRIGAGKLRAWNDTAADDDEAAPAAPAGLSVYFACCYFLYYLCGHTGTNIPYDALGMELTTDYNDKTALFGAKTAFMFGGYILQIACGVAFSILYATDVLRQIYMQALLFAALFAIALATLLAKVKEQPPSAAAEKNAMPLVPSVRAMFANGPYMQYLIFRIPMTIASLLPANLLVDYVKFVMQIENFNTTFYTVMGIVLLSVFCAIPVLVRASSRYGKKQVLAATCLVEGLVYAASCATPPSAMTAGMIYPLALFVGFGMAASFVLPDAILADCIDYDELHTGLRNEGLYTVLETNLQQYVEIIGGVAPALVAHYAGFASNGGCSCGCGTECSAPYLRWSCPHDAGYACSGSFDATVLYGERDRIAPCTQQTEATQLTFRFFMLGVPAVCYVLAAWPAWRMQISQTKHEEIIAQLHKRDASAQQGLEPAEPLTDPITGKEVRLRQQQDMFAEHYAASELRRARATPNAARSLRLQMAARLAVWAITVALLLAGMIGLQASGQETAFQTLVTLGCLAFAGVFVLIAWDVRRLQVTWRCPPGMPNPSSGQERSTEDVVDDAASNSRLRYPASPKM